MSEPSVSPEEFSRVFSIIRETPGEYLEKKSLAVLQAFWTGYTDRDGTHAGLRIFSPDGFHEFVNEKYRNDSSHNAVSVINLYVPDCEGSWSRYFELLDEFSCREREPVQPAASPRPSPEFRELLLLVINRPALFVGNSCFSLIAAFINGWLRATADLQYKESDYERKFVRLLKYIETFDINLPGPSWNSIIWFWTMHDDGAIELLKQYIDEYIDQEKGWIQRIEYQMQRRLDSRGTV